MEHMMYWWQIVQIMLIIITSVVVGIFVGNLSSYLIRRLAKKLSVKKHEMIAVFEEQFESSIPDLLMEVESNRRIATESLNGRLLPFQNQAYNRNQDKVSELPANVRNSLSQAYIDISLANKIVWLATELGRRSQELDDCYSKLCTNIAIMFDTIGTTRAAKITNLDREQEKVYAYYNRVVPYI